MDEMGSLPQAFTRYVIEKMSEKANLGEGEACYAAIRNDNNNNVLGEINGYSVSLSGETVTLFTPSTNHKTMKSMQFQPTNTRKPSIACKVITTLPWQDAATRWNHPLMITRFASISTRTKRTSPMCAFSS